MRTILYLLGLLLVVATSESSYKPNSDSERIESMEAFHDTLIGNFNGVDVDTLISEPIDSLDVNSGGHFYTWRVFTKNGTVKDLILEQTTGVRFIGEGDLDNNGTEEWGYITEWPSSNWMRYHAFTNIDGAWHHLITPSDIWMPHIDAQDSTNFSMQVEDIVQLSEQPGVLKVKFSDLRENHEGDVEFVVVDTLVQIRLKQGIRIAP